MYHTPLRSDQNWTTPSPEADTSIGKEARKAVRKERKKERKKTKMEEVSTTRKN